MMSEKSFAGRMINQLYVPITILQSKCMTNDMPVSIDEISSGAFVTRTVLAVLAKSQHDYSLKKDRNRKSKNLLRPRVLVWFFFLMQITQQ